MFYCTTHDKKYSFLVSRRNKGNYFVWIVSEFSLPDNNGTYMRVKLLAQFGNTKNHENFVYAKAFAIALCGAWND